MPKKQNTNDTNKNNSKNEGTSYMNSYPMRILRVRFYNTAKLASCIQNTATNAIANDITSQNLPNS